VVALPLPPRLSVGNKSLPKKILIPKYQNDNPKYSIPSTHILVGGVYPRRTTPTRYTNTSRGEYAAWDNQ
jgi:hypothetical protein